MPYKINRTTGVTEYINPTTGATLTPASSTELAPAQSGGFLRTVTNTLVPRTAQLLKKAKAGIGLSILTNQEEEEREKRQKLIEQMISKAKAEADPTRRSQLLGQARDLAAQSTQRIKSVITNFENESGTKLNDKDRVMAEALGVAGELGTFLMPVGKLAAVGKTGKLVSRAGQIGEATTLTERILKSAKLGKATKRIVKGAEVGATVGAVSALTDPEEMDAGERLAKTATGVVTGSAVGGASSAVFESAFKVARKVLGSDKSKREVIAKVFRLGDSKRKEYQASTGGADFEAELLAREGKNIAGMDYDSLVNHFRSKADEAVSARNEIISTSDQTVKKSPLIAKMKSLLKSLDPKEGNVGTAGARNQVQGVIDEISLIPDNEISLVKAERIKERLQNMGKEAFSPSKEPTAASEALAEASRFTKKAIEKAAEKGGKNVKEANRAIQFYETAYEAISTQKNQKLISSAQSVMRSLVQQMPVIAGASVGLGVGATTGDPVKGLQYGSIALALVGGGKVAGNKLMSPEIQTRVANRFTTILEKQGVQNAGQMAQDISQEISKHIARVASQSDAPLADSVFGAVSSQAIPSGRDIIVSQNQEIGSQQYQDQANSQQQDVIHTPSVSETVTIRNKKTGEVKQVNKNELSQYGLAGKPCQDYQVRVKYWPL